METHALQYSCVNVLTKLALMNLLLPGPVPNLIYFAIGSDPR